MYKYSSHGEGVFVSRLSQAGMAAQALWGLGTATPIPIALSLGDRHHRPLRAALARLSGALSPRFTGKGGVGKRVKKKEQRKGEITLTGRSVRIGVDFTLTKVHVKYGDVV